MQRDGSSDRLRDMVPCFRDTYPLRTPVNILNADRVSYFDKKIASRFKNHM